LRTVVVIEPATPTTAPRTAQRPSATFPSE
jgi:hypothetical protein